MQGIARALLISAFLWGGTAPLLAAEANDHGAGTPSSPQSQDRSSIERPVGSHHLAPHYSAERQAKSFQKMREQRQRRARMRQDNAPWGRLGGDPASHRGASGPSRIEQGFPPAEPRLTPAKQPLSRHTDLANPSSAARGKDQEKKPSDESESASQEANTASQE